LQLTENKVLQLLTYGFARIGAPILCSGANLAYNKKRFQDLQPYQHNLDILSGDDLFLLETFMQQEKITIGTSNDPALILQTMAKSTWSAYFAQRIRWSSKSKYLKNYLMHIIAIISIGAHAAGLASILLYCVTQQLIFLYFLGLKIIIELVIGFTGQLKLEKKFTAAGVLISSFYSLVLIYMLIFSFRKTTTWKGRTL
jgi:poly-beta-1,6-N-acetyl-D-glucosamine synthase